MNIGQENSIKIRNYPAGARPVIDRDTINHTFDLLRARVRERSTWAVWSQRAQEILVTLIVIVLGSITGWSLVR